MICLHEVLLGSLCNREDLQQRLDRVFRRNMDFEEVEDCIFKLHCAVQADDHQRGCLEKARATRFA